MDIHSYQKVKFRYKLLFAAIIVLGIAVSVFPTLQFASWFANHLDLDMHQPAKDSINGLLWSLGFLVVGLVNIALCSFIVVALVSKINRWDLNQVKEIFIRNKYPKHWLKES